MGSRFVGAKHGARQVALMVHAKLATGPDFGKYQVHVKVIFHFCGDALAFFFVVSAIRNRRHAIVSDPNMINQYAIAIGCVSVTRILLIRHAALPAELVAILICSPRLAVIR
jgi:hypothetical protein